MIDFVSHYKKSVSSRSRILILSFAEEWLYEVRPDELACTLSGIREDIYVETCIVSADVFLGTFQNKTEKVNNTGCKILNKNIWSVERQV